MRAVAMNGATTAHATTADGIHYSDALTTRTRTRTGVDSAATIAPDPVMLFAMQLVNRMQAGTWETIACTQGNTLSIPNRNIEVALDELHRDLSFGTPE